MAKGQSGWNAAGTVFTSYTGKLTAALKRAGDRPVSVEVIFTYLDNYPYGQPRQFVAPMQFYQDGYTAASSLRARIGGAGGRLQFWRNEAAQRGQAVGVGGVMRIVFQIHDKWSTSGTRPGKRGG